MVSTYANHAHTHTHTHTRIYDWVMYIYIAPLALNFPLLINMNS